MDINEDSLDLYTDLISEDYSNQPSKTDSTESQQQISEVLDTAKATIESLNIELQEKAKKEAELQKRIEILEKNNSSLLLTAKSELGRKNSIISDLRDQIDEHTKSLFYNGKFNKYPDKNQSYSSRKSENSMNVSPAINSRKRKNEVTDDKKDSKRCRTTRRSEDIVTKNDSEIESKTVKLMGSHSPKTKLCDVTSDKIKPCDTTNKVETFDLRDKLRRRKLSGRDGCQRQNIVSKSASNSNKIVITNGENNLKSCENQINDRVSKSDTGVTSLPVPYKAVDSDGNATLSEKEMKLQKSTSLKQTSKCSIMDVVNKLSNKANENHSKFVIPKMSKRRSSIEGDIDNKVLDSSLSAESSDETEKLIVDLNSASELKISPYNSRVNAKAINAKCKVSQSEMVNLNHDLNGNTEKVPKTFQSKKKQTSTESDSDFASKLQYCVDMLSDSDPNETLETSTNRVQKVNDMEPCVLKHVKDPNERELMSPPKSVPKKKKCENKNLLDSESQKSANRSPNVSENVAPDSVSNILTDSDLNLVQTQSVVNRILDLSKSVALNVQTQNVTHRSPVENNYEEPKHNTISYFTWKIPQQLTFSDKNLLSCKYQEQTRVFGIQDVPLSDPRTKITRDNISDTNIAPKTPKLVPYTRVNEAAAIDLMLKDRNKKVNKSASFGETHKDHKKKTSSKSKDSEKESGTMADITDNDGVKIRLDLPHKRQERETAVKTSRSDIASKDTKQQKTIISKNEDREMQCTSTDMKKTTKKTSTKKLSSLKSNKGEKSVSKTKPLTQKSAKSKEKSAISNDLRHEFVTENITNKELEHSERKSDTVETDSLPSPRSHLPLVDTSVVKDESHSIELTTLESVTKPNESSGISNQFQSTEAIEVKSEPNSEPAPPTSSGLNAFSGMFMTNLAGSSNETEFLKRLKKMEEEIQMMKSAAIQSLQSKVIFKTENVFTSQESDGQQILEAGTNDNPIIIPSSSDVATDISRALVNESESTFSESGNVVGNQSDNRPDKSQSTNKSSENVSKDVDCPLSPVKTSNIGKSVSKTVPIRGDADSSSVHSALQTCNSKNMTKVSMNTTEDSNSSNNSSFSVHSTDSSVSSSYNTNNVRNSFTKHETLVSCNISDTDETLSESSEDDMDIETDLHYDNNMDINQNATEVLKTDLDMSSDSEDASKHHSNILPQNVQTPNHVVKNMKTPMKQDIRSPWNRISPVPKFVSPENVNCDSKLLALVNLATLDLHLSGHDVPFENKALSSKNENNSNASPEVLSSTPCFRKTRSHGKSFKTCLPELKSNDVIDSNMVKFDNRLKNNESNSSFLTPVNSPSIEKRDTSKASLTESPIPMASSDTPTSPEFEIEKSIITDGLKTHSDQPPAEIQLPQEVKRSPNIEDFKIFQSVENDTVEDTPEPISEKEDGEITQDSLIVNDNQKQLSVNTDSVYFVIDTKVDENDELFKCSDAENSLSEKPSKRLVTPKKKQMCSVKTRSSPRIRTKSLHDRLGVRDRTERRASDANNKRKKRRSPSPRLPRSNGRRRLYDNDNIKSDHKSDSKPMRKPLTDSPRDRDRDNERLRHKDEPRRRNSRDRSNRDRNRSGNCRSRS